MTLLTVNGVEELHEAIQNGAKLEGIIAHFEQATLPAILEYGCLRWAMPTQVPQLPEAIRESVLGKALSQVQSPLGFQSDGQKKNRLKRIDVQAVEFHEITGIDDAYNEFEIRFDRSAQSLGIAPQKAHALQAALHEMVDNSLIHSGAPAVLAGYSILDGLATFSVVDVGIGVLNSLRTHSAYQDLRFHTNAIRTALQDGATRFGPNTRGMGFRQIFKALAAEWGQLRFRSGNGCLSLDGRGLDADQGRQSFPPTLPGFQVTVCCRPTAPRTT